MYRPKVLISDWRFGRDVERLVPCVSRWAEPNQLAVVAAAWQPGVVILQPTRLGVDLISKIPSLLELAASPIVVVTLAVKNVLLARRAIGAGAHLVTVCDDLENLRRALYEAAQAAPRPLRAVG